MKTETINDGLDPDITAASFMRSLLKPDYPDYIIRLLNQVKGWLTKTFQIDGINMPYWEIMRANPDALFNELSWIESKVALLPSPVPPAPQAEAVTLYLGELDTYEALRLAVDYSLIFSKGACRRMWIVTDSWVTVDVLGFKDHINAMQENGIALRFLIVTPWGWVEFPVSSLGKIELPPFDDERGKRRRRNDSD